jgi:hypothetical protein
MNIDITVICRIRVVRRICLIGRAGHIDILRHGIHYNKQKPYRNYVVNPFTKSVGVHGSVVG